MPALLCLAAAAASFSAMLLVPRAIDADTLSAPPRGARGETVAAAVADETVTYLVRSTLLSLENANRSGNYTVLRALATPEFQRSNSDAGLAAAFAALRQAGIDLSPAAVVAPLLETPAVPDAHNRLRLAGSLPGGGQPVGFDLQFAAVGGFWRLDAIAVRILPPPASRRGA